MGGCTRGKCPRDRDLSHVAQDTAKSQFCHNEPNSPQWGCGDSRGADFGSRGAFAVKTTKNGGSKQGRCDFEPRSPRYGHTTVLAHNQPKMGFRVRLTVRPMLGFPWSSMFDWHVICHRKSIQPRVQSPQSGFGALLGYFGPVLAYSPALAPMGPF